MRKTDGFTLLEIIAALTLFSLVVFSLISAGTASRRNTAESERLTTAVQLVQSKMTEMELKYQGNIDNNGVKSSFNEESGQFESPYENFSWKVDFKETPFKLTKENMLPLLKQLGIQEDLAEVQFDESRLVVGNLNKAIEENMGELYVEVAWKERGNTKKIPLVTHLMPRKPKIELSLNPE
ncbi:MAG: prepilin-type N-terminal cleavage/methylation domain-containing protein [Proteobacteria bacterium]|jgi:type II secretory pathway pseudopilin PulG|nr:prepilin-type N-terminal cleavage/methylation domain-containing protein [Pseudomonadota bacterium]